MVEEFDNGWLDMSLAPRDGTEILVARNNDVSWEYQTVWWVPDPTYPWQSDNNAYPEDRFDAWKPIGDGPYVIEH